MSLLDVIAEVDRHEPREFMAPILDTRVTDVFVNLDNIPYRFEIVQDKDMPGDAVSPGWWIMKPTSKRIVEALGPAHPSQYLKYLDALPRFFVIALFPLSKDGHTWLCMPYNISDATQRGWPDGGVPLPLHLVRGRIFALDALKAKSLAGAMIYDDIAYSGSAFDIGAALRNRLRLTGAPDVRGASPEFLAAFHIVRDRIEQAKKEERARAIREKRMTQEDEIRWKLDFMGAELVDWRQAGDGYVVEWRFGNVVRKVTVRRDGRIASAGICLSGLDSQENLSSIVKVMEDAR